MNLNGVTGNKDSFASVPARANFDIKITAIGSTAPYAHSWKKVVRQTNHTWLEIGDGGSTTVDPAYDYNGGQATVGEIRPAFRHPATNEVLFF